MNIAVIILAGGGGVRYKSKQPKQFTRLYGSVPTFIHSTIPFLGIKKTRLKSLIFVAPEAHVKQVYEQTKKFIRTEAPVSVISGGAQRISSIFLGIEYLLINKITTDIVLIHDGVRPLIHIDDIEGLIAHFKNQKLDAGVVVKPLYESLFYNEGNRVSCKNREEYFLGETPDIFKLSLLKQIFKKYAKKSLSHETIDIMELISKEQKFKIGAYIGKYPNIKLTFPHDAVVIKKYAAKRI